MRHALPLLLLLPLAVRAGEPEAFFESKVRPLLVDHCYSCHSDAAKKVKGDLKLDTQAGRRKAVVPGKPDESPLVQAVRRNHKEMPAMPPDTPLSQEQVAVLEQWVKAGAVAPADAPPTKKTETLAEAKARWPFTPVPKAVPVPVVRATSWPKTDIDRFILAKLAAKNLTPVGDADKRTLVRRATFDLLGLPPTPAEVEAFLKDTSPDAFETLIDRLLASPHYGERWGRHWLDVVRYSDTAGDNSDFPIPQMALYRDWVIDAINRDLPYDQFVRQQIAGDLMIGGTEAERKQRTIATGYIANARRFGSTVPDYPWHLTIEDTLDNVGRAFLGLTLNCARCHDHKFDPVSMKDYYALYGVFASTRYPWPGIELEQRQRDLVVFADPAAVKAEQERRAKANKEYDAEIKRLDEAKKAVAGDDTKKEDELRKQRDALKEKQRKDTGVPLPFATAYAVAEGPKAADAAVQMKGDPKKTADVVKRRFLDVLGGQELADDDTSSGRLALAAWVSSPDNPLFARVMVNRVWHHHFGRGLVATPNDFGKQGTAPTHPELLDHLARQFIADGFSLKTLHKRMMLSRVYQLSSSGEVKGADTADPTNELLGKFRLRRLDAESIRDTLLLVSGNLDTKPPGPHPFPEQPAWNFTQHNPFRAVYEHNHRSVYLMVQRIQRHPFLANFDGADTGASTGSRVTSTTALQSLYFLNDPFVHAQAKGLAGRVTGDDDGRIRQLHEVLFARPATDAEVSKGREYLTKAKDAGADNPWESYARALFRLNEFVYVD
jgi:mono/diheme cytochrome c family protein